MAGKALSISHVKPETTPINRIPLLTFLLVLSLFISCNDSSTSKTLSSKENQTQDTSGNVYFSVDNGLSWQPKSDGLPESITIGDLAASETTIGLLSKETGVYVFDFKDDAWKSIPTETEITAKNPTSISFFDGNIYVGTQLGGIYFTQDLGEHWEPVNQGLNNLTIRRFSIIADQLYIGTNDGLYTLKEGSDTWEFVYGNPTMQVNGMTEFRGNIYIGTTQGIFTSPIGQKEWKNVLSNYTLHNISSDDDHIYAMTYNELFSSADDGASWQSIQNGLPKELYTFNVVRYGSSVFAGQWDGVYRKNGDLDKWHLTNRGLPADLSITKMKTFKNFIVVGGNEMGLRRGASTDK